MNYMIIGVVFSLLIFCTTASATDIATQQSFLSFNIIKDNKLVSGGSTIVSPREGILSSGSNNYYPRVQCQQNGRILDTIPVFTGVTITHVVSGKDIIINLVQYDVSSPEEEIRALKNNECRNLIPQQIVVQKRALILPYEKTNAESIVPLDNGYVFRYQILPTLQW